MTVTTPAADHAALGAPAAAPPRRLAVFGSVSAERPSRAIVDPPASVAREVLERVYAQISAQAPQIAQPTLERAVATGALSAAERDELLRELADPQSSTEPSARPGRSLAARTALRAALGDVRRASPGIAQPILHAAVLDGLLTAAQEQRILSRLYASPAATFRPARGQD